MRQRIVGCLSYALIGALVLGLAVLFLNEARRSPAPAWVPKWAQIEATIQPPAAPAANRPEPLAARPWAEARCGSVEPPRRCTAVTYIGGAPETEDTYEIAVYVFRLETETGAEQWYVGAALLEDSQVVGGGSFVRQGVR